MSRVMVVDGGARGHVIALAYKKVGCDVLVVPGNDGMTQVAVPTKKPSLKDVGALVDRAKIFRDDLVDVAQDDALALGLVDKLDEEGIPAFGPTQAAARIESDKEFSRIFMGEEKIPGPAWGAFDQQDENAISFAEGILALSGIVFFKAAGLYAGKGVVAARNKQEIRDAFQAMQGMGDASKRFLVEEGLVGEEFSWYAISDGYYFKSFKSAQDNKRVYAGNQGPNTGGMGSHSPAMVTKGLEERIEQELVRPVIEGLARNGTPYKGILYVGGIKCKDGSLRIIEYNSRWGDPEAQVIIPGITSNYLDMINAAREGKLKDFAVTEDDHKRVCIVGASLGYPGDYEKGKRIWLGNLPDVDTWLYSAGMKAESGSFVTGGGRLFNIVANHPKSLFQARKRALEVMATINVEGGFHYRADIAQKDIDWEIRNFG